MHSVFHQVNSPNLELRLLLDFKCLVMLNISTNKGIIMLLYQILLRLTTYSPLSHYRKWNNYCSDALTSDIWVNIWAENFKTIKDINARFTFTYYVLVSFSWLTEIFILKPFCTLLERLWVSWNPHPLLVVLPLKPILLSKGCWQNQKHYWTQCPNDTWGNSTPLPEGWRHPLNMQIPDYYLAGKCQPDFGCQMKRQLFFASSALAR